MKSTVDFTGKQRQTCAKLAFPAFPSKHCNNSSSSKHNKNIDIKDIKLLGASVPRPESTQCPGEGSTDWTKDLNPIRNGVLGWEWITKGREETGDEWGTRTKPKLTFGPVTVLFSSIITERKE